MNITRFIATDEGGSRFDEIEIPFANVRRDAEGHALRYSNPYASPAVSFVELPEGLTQDWHQAPARQVAVVLSGTVEVTTTDGEVRRWERGNAFMPADVSGRGHRTRAIGGPVRLLFAPLPEDFPADGWC